MAEGRNLTLAVTGASGAVYASAMLRMLVRDARVGHLNLAVSASGMRILSEELGLTGRSGVLQALLGDATEEKVELLHHDDVGANIASGSYPSDGMVVLPCSMGTLAAIANGLAGNVIERAADVCLKERRPLLLCVRETPFNRIHLRNMTLAAEAGAVIFPCMPTLYNHPQSTQHMAEQFCARVLAMLGLSQEDAYVWRG